MHINKDFRLPLSEYYSEIVTKNQIYLHHTVGGTGRSSLMWWIQDPRKVGAAYLVERDGTVYETFPPERWIHHLGIKADFNRKVNMQSIAIELCSEGALRGGDELNKLLEINNQIPRFKEEMLYAFDIVENNSPNIWFKNAKPLYLKSQTHMYEDLKEKWRGFRYFDKYDEKQIQSVFELVKYLCKSFNIPKNIVPHTHYDINLANSFKGILAHSNVREDKSDVHKLFPWNDLSKFINNS